MAYGLIDKADGLWLWEGIGYPAAGPPSPMWPSVQLGRSALVTRVMRYPIGTKSVFSGYSQGAMVVDQVWTEDCLNPAGVLHDRYLNGDIVRIYNYGDPFRCPGVANGNLLAGQPLPVTLDGAVTGGIGGALDLTAAQTPSFLKSFANNGDIYACCPVGSDPWTKEAEAGLVGTSIFKVIMQATFLDVISVAADLFVPIGMVEEIINGIVFLAAGTNAPHWQYWAGMDAAINEMVELGNQILSPGGLPVQS
jgi:hypothetical protein